jgi:hypothetical protein
VGLDIDMDVQGAPLGGEHVHLRRGYFADTDQLRRALVALGMAFDTPVPEFPDSDHLDRTDFRDDEPVTDRARRYHQQRERVLADHDTGAQDYQPGIPTHKLSSADGWHVTDKECTEALAAYAAARRAGATHPAAFGADVIPFLRTAAAFAGFRVH